MDENNPIPAAGPCSSKRSADNQSSGPPRDSSKKKSRSISKDNADQETVLCSSRHCKACTAVLIADGVAVCCCPLAVVSLLALVFIKVPYMVGKRCFGLRRKRKEINRKCWKNEADSSSAANYNDLLARNRIGSHHRDDHGCNHNDIVFEFRKGKEVVVVEEEKEKEEEEERKSFCAGFEAERFFLELYQVGQLGFGRISFTGVQ
ncbi:hypothetical protein Dimus_018679 [Dionaea muscipula]